MNRLFRERSIPGVQVDPDECSSKHDSVGFREQRGLWKASSQKRFITARRLGQWLISDWQHKRRWLQRSELDFEPVRSGLFYSLRLGGTWVAADWWLHYFEVDDQVTALRLEHLHEDINRYLLPLLPPSTPAFEAPPKENSKPTGMTVDEPCFTSTDLQRIAAVNPRWSAWQQRVYGQHPE